MITFDEIIKNPEIKAYIQAGDELLGAMGYTDHSEEHSLKTGELAGTILETLGHSPRMVDLCKIAAYMHDIGCMVSRVGHPQSGAMISFNILTRLGMDYNEIALITGAIGNHDEDCGIPVSPISAALIIADKSDMRRSRVRIKEMSAFDIHDRVNYSIVNNQVRVSAVPPEILLDVTITTDISSVIDFFEIFHSRMLMCKRAAEFLGASFKLMINRSEIM